MIKEWDQGQVEGSGGSDQRKACFKCQGQGLGKGGKKTGSGGRVVLKNWEHLI